MRNLGVFFVLFCIYATGVFADAQKEIKVVCLEFFRFLTLDQPIDHQFLKLINRELKKGERIKMFRGGEGRVAPITYNGETYYIKIPHNHEKYRFNTEAPEWKIEEIKQWMALQNLAAKHNIAPKISLIESSEAPPMLVSKEIPGTKTLEDFIEDRYKKIESKGGLKNEQKEVWLKSFYKNIFQKIYKMQQLGIDHGDLKPQNILVNEQGEVFFIDFGSAKALATGRGDPFKNYKKLESELQKEFLEKGDFLLLHTPRYANGRLTDFKAGTSDAYAASIILKDLTHNNNPNDFYIKVHPADENPGQNRSPETIPKPIGLWYSTPTFYKDKPYLRALMLAAEFGVSRKHSYEEAHRIHLEILDPNKWNKAIDNIEPSKKDLQDFEQLVKQMKPIDQIMVLYGDKNNPLLNNLREKIFLNSIAGRENLIRLKAELDSLDNTHKTIGPDHVLNGNASSHFIDKVALQEDVFKATIAPQIHIATPQPKEEDKKLPAYSKWAIAAGVLGGMGLGAHQYLNSDDDEKKKQARKEAPETITQAAQTLSHIASDLEQVMKEIENPKEEPKPTTPIERKPAVETKEDKKPARPQLKADLNTNQDCTCRGEWSEWTNNTRTRLCVIRDRSNKIIGSETQSNDDIFCFKSCSPETPYVNALARQEKIKLACKSIKRLDPIDWPETKVSKSN